MKKIEFFLFNGGLKGICYGILMESFLQKDRFFDLGFMIEEWVFFGFEKIAWRGSDGFMDCV